MTTYLSIAGMLALVLLPVLIPAIITAVHVLTGQTQTSTQDRAAVNFPRRTASPRLAVPAMA
jgi:ABC-type transport system involved in cytochrome c biogenesis permease component